MGKVIDINTWKFLINRLDESQKKELLKKKNIRIGSIQTQLVNKQSQWKIVLNRLNSELNNPNVQKAIKEYYIDDLVPTLKEDLELSAEHLQDLDQMEQKDFEKNVDKYGYIYVLLYLITKNDNEKVNVLITFQPEEVVVEKEIDTSKVELSNTLEQINELKKELIIVKKAHKGLQKKYDLLEKRNNEMISKKTKEIEEIKQEYYKEIEDALNTIDSDRQEHEEQLNILKAENRNLENQLQEEKIKKREKNEKVNETDIKNRKTKVLVFGDLPITVQKKEEYDFMFFDQDISTYLFNEDYDEYWCIEDKLSSKEKRQLQKSIHCLKITFDKKYYSNLVR